DRPVLLEQEQRDRGLLEHGVQQPPLGPHRLGQDLRGRVVLAGGRGRGRGKLLDRRVDQRPWVGAGQAGCLAERVSPLGDVRHCLIRPSASRHIPAILHFGLSHTHPMPRLGPLGRVAVDRQIHNRGAPTMALILLVLILAILFGGLGFILHALWWVAAIVLVVWLVGFAVRAGEGRRWYRW